MAEILCLTCNEIVTFSKNCKCVFYKNNDKQYSLPIQVKLHPNNAKSVAAGDEYMSLAPSIESETVYQKNCSFSLEKKLPKNSSSDTSQETYLEIEEFSAATKFSDHTHFWPGSKKLCKKVSENLEGNRTDSSNSSEILSQQVLESISLVDRVSESIESTKHADTVLESFESHSDFLISLDSRFTSVLTPEDTVSKRKPYNCALNTNKKAYECDKCKEIFSSQRYFNRHYKSHSDENHTVCGKSQKVIFRKDQLERQKRTQTLKKPFFCNICERTYTNSYSLNKHYRIHAKENWVECDVCKKSFSLKSNLNSHYRIHTKEKPFVCNMCGKGFSHKISLVFHHNTHWGEKPYECDVCEKKFNRKDHLVNHKRTHTGEKPYECGICKKRFNQTSSFLSHNRMHTKEMPFGCDLCEKRFRNRGPLAFHRRKHTVEKPWV